MHCTHLNFDYRKATQAVNYFAHKNGGIIDKLKVIKLIYFADRFHLRKYGCPVTNDEYYAMKLGPVNSGVKDIIDTTDFIDEKEQGYSSQYLYRDSGNLVKSINEVDLKIFAKSDIEALEFSWDKFGKYDGVELMNLTHKYPEWKKHEEALNSGKSRVRMDYIDFLCDPDPGYDPCFELTGEEKAANLVMLKELSHVQDCWN